MADANTPDARERLVRLEEQMIAVRQDVSEMRSEVRRMSDALTAVRGARWLLATIGAIVAFFLGIASQTASLWRGQ